MTPWLPLWIVLLAGAPGTAEAATCEATEWSFEVPEDKAEQIDDTVLVIFYTNQDGHELNDDAKDGLKADDLVGREGSMLEHIDYIGFANAKEIRAPTWVVTRIIKARRKRFTTPVYVDKDRCYSGTGESKKCLAGQRKDYFDPKQTSIAVTYDGRLLERFDGDVDAGRLVDFIRSATEAAAEDRDFCWVRENVEY